MKYLIRLFFLSASFAVYSEEVAEVDEDSEELTVEPHHFILPPEMCYPCYPELGIDADVDEVWFWENEAMYPTRKEDSWVEDLSRPW